MESSYSKDTAASFRYCQRLTKKRAHNFYYGIRLLPTTEFQAVCALYAWMRKIDDIADGQDTREKKIKKLKRFYYKSFNIINSDEQTLAKLTKNKHWLAFRHMVLANQIPWKYFFLATSGQLQDLYRSHYLTYQHLYRHCYKVASSVGLILNKIWGYQRQNNADQLAEHLGIALQLTNILRDVKEDAERGRVYLPAEFFSLPKVDKETLEQLEEQQLISVIQHTAEYAFHEFEQAESLLDEVPEVAASCTKTMLDIHRDILTQLSANPQLALKRKTSIHPLRKCWIAIRSSLD